MNSIKSIILRALLSVAGISIFLLAAEGTIRILYPNIIPTTAYDWSSRHKGHALKKPPGVFRIVALGDSYTFGQGVKRDETFPRQFEKMLNKSIPSNPETRFEVINLGFCGLNTVGELEVLAYRGLNPETWQPDERYRGLAYEPDLILLEYTLNDASRSGRALEQIKEFDDKWRTGEIIQRVNVEPYRIPMPESVDKFLTKNSRFYLFFMNRYNKLKANFSQGNEQGNYSTDLNRYKDGSREWGGSVWALKEIAEISRENGVAPLLVVYPQMVELNNYPFKEVHKKIIRTASSLGFYTLDLFPAFEGKDAKSLWVTPVDGHPGARAHEIAAKAIFEYLKKEHLAPLQ